MSPGFAVRLFVVSLSTTVVCAQLRAQESQSDLRSILVADDLRPLIDLESPTTPEPAPRSADVDAPASTIQGPGSKSSRPTPESAPASVDSSQKSEFDDHIFDLGIAAVGKEGGVKVRGVFVDSPAQRAGLKSGDSISSVGGAPLSTVKQLSHLLAYQRALGEQFPITVDRQGKQRSFNIIMPSTLDDRQTPNSAQTVGKQPAQTVPSGTVNVPQSNVRQRIPAQRVSNQSQSTIGPNSPAPQSTRQEPRIVNGPTAARQPIVAPTQPQPYVVPGTQQRPIPAAEAQQQPTTQQRVIRRYAPQQVVRSGEVPVGGRQQQIQQQYRQQPVRGRGRLIGNGRIINSVLRAFGR